MNRLYIRCAMCDTALVNGLCPKCNSKKLGVSYKPCEKSISGNCKMLHCKLNVKWCMRYNCDIKDINFNCE